VTSASTNVLKYARHAAKTKTKKMVSFGGLARTETKQSALSNAAETAAKRIQDLCFAIEQATTQSTTQSTGTNSNSYIGVLIDERNGFLHRIWPPRAIASLSYLSGAVPLDDLLVPGLLETKVRLNLGVHLATATMQLHASEWLTERWGKQDILFLQRSIPRLALDGTVISIREPVIDKPFVRRTFEPPSRQTNTVQATMTEPLVQCNNSLFSLGVVLMELWFERRIEDFGSGKNLSGVNDNSVYETARQYIGELLRVAGENYGIAVSRCLNGLSRPMENKSLDCAIYKNAVHADIVCLLQKNLKVHRNPCTLWRLLIFVIRPLQTHIHKTVHITNQHRLVLYRWNLASIYPAATSFTSS
jgi:hypothetical protein